MLFPTQNIHTRSQVLKPLFFTSATNVEIKSNHFAATAVRPSIAQGLDTTSEAVAALTS